MSRTDPPPAHTNALAGESSPYLLQHAHNPVDWHPWGPRAFELARAAGKPIFLSIGYSTCYWCHVMERQCFENQAIAALMNEHFVNIKVDREERPDVDDVYMSAVQMITGRGGWPMSVFLTNDQLMPFYAGTYFPPEPMGGMPSFPQVLTGLAQAWRDRRDEVLTQAQQVAQLVRQHFERKATGDAEPGVYLVQNTVGELLGVYDHDQGGFGGAPKFPQPSNLLLLLAVYRGNAHDELGKAIAYTLERMARGGMYDQVGGGFHRYSTDDKWLVPHFEKMLYDNAQLVEAYVIAHELMPPADDPDYFADVARQTCDYVLREMLDDIGTFWSAQDAEVDAREGLNYLWTPDEVRAAIGDAKLAELALRALGLDRGTNFRDPHHPGEPARNVLYLPVPRAELAPREGVSLEDLKRSLDQARAQLLKVRNQRKQPGTDDKTLTSWNGLMIAALARAGQALGEPRYTAAAARAADTIDQHLRSADGSLLRTARRGQAKIPAFLEDYANFVHGLLELHRATDDPRFLAMAEHWTAAAVERFAAQEGGYYDTLAGQADLFVRTRSVHDGAVASGNSQMVHNLVDLFELTGKAEYFERAARDLQAFAADMHRHGMGMVHMVHAFFRALTHAPERFAGVPPLDTGRQQPVRIDVDPRKLELGSGQDTVRVTIEIAEGYHVNSNNPRAAGVIPTTLELESAPGLALDVQYPPAVAKKYEFASDLIHVFEGQVTITAKLRRTRAPGSVAADSSPTSGGPRLKLRLQVCTDTTCLEPREVELPVEIVN